MGSAEATRLPPGADFDESFGVLAVLPSIFPIYIQMHAVSTPPATAIPPSTAATFPPPPASVHPPPATVRPFAVVIPLRAAAASPPRPAAGDYRPPRIP